MNKLRLTLALNLSLLIRFCLHKLNRSGGHALPGLIALKIYPHILTEFTPILEKVIIITGTNGKTTTARLMAEILTKHNIAFIHNRFGSNLKRGIVSSLINSYRKYSQKGKNKKRKKVWGLFEVDEAVLESVHLELKSDYILITNLFRDQLDRYGEVESTLNKWRKTLLKNPPQELILNANDPFLASLKEGYKGKVSFFGLSDQNIGSKKLKHAADALFCPLCQKALIYKRVYYAHEGQFKCQTCSFKTPKLKIWASNIKTSSLKNTFTVQDVSKKIRISSLLPGLYNIYNVLAAASLTELLGLNYKKLAGILTDFQPAFGRGERFKLKSKNIQILLIKNPTGLNEVIERLLHEKEKLTLLIIINDKIADGRDISWLWDADFEKLLAHTNTLYVSGKRAHDMALRAKIAGFKKINIESSIKIASKKFLSLRKKNLFILPTYTSLLELKKQLNKMGLVKKSWEE